MPCKPLYCMCGNYAFPQRYAITLLMFLGITAAYCQRISLNLIITAMVYQPRNNITGDASYCPVNVSAENDTSAQFYWSPLKQAIVKLTFYVGYALFQLPGGMLADLYGGRLILSGCIAFSTTACILSPTFIVWGGWILLSILRFFMGIFQAGIFPAVFALIGNWIPQNERSTFSTIAFSGAHVGTMTGTAGSGFIVHYAPKWSYAFYFWGLIAIIWFSVFVFYGYSDPSTHPFITEDEKRMLSEKIATRTKTKTPWKEILSDIHLWGTISGTLGHDFVFYLLTTDLPNFIHNMLGYDIKNNGILSSIPFMAYWISSIIFAKIADFFINKGVKIIVVRRVATFTANIGSSCCLLLVPYVGCNRPLVISIFVFTLFLESPIFSGAFINHLDRTVHFSGLVSGLGNGIGAIAGGVTPYMVAAVAYDHTISQWRLVFWINFVVTSTLTTFSLIFMSGERAAWDVSHDIAAT